MATERPNSAYPECVTRLIEEFGRLPGIGRRSAERLAFFMLKSPEGEALKLAHAITDVKRKIRHCSVCWNLTDIDPCPICVSTARDASTILVVEQPKDLISLEQTGMYRGIYHVLMGRIDPLDGVGADSLTMKDLLRRVAHPESNARGVAVREVILGMNPDMEGESTGLQIAASMARRGIKVTRLARGLPAGGQIEYASKAVLADAIACRQEL
ncbi:MAG: recombination mediator RecR [Planctomycetota bacterium]|nr:recombination mediator RecR [Planctomycetota bacterium]